MVAASLSPPPCSSTQYNMAAFSKNRMPTVEEAYPAAALSQGTRLSPGISSVQGHAAKARKRLHRLLQTLVLHVTEAYDNAGRDDGKRRAKIRRSRGTRRPTRWRGPRGRGCAGDVGGRRVTGVGGGRRDPGRRPGGAQSRRARVAASWFLAT